MSTTHAVRFSSWSIKARLRQARRECRLIQAQVARRLGQTPANVSHIEAGRTEPTVERSAELAEIYGKHPLEIMGGYPADVCALADLLAAMPDARRRAAATDLALRIAALIELGQASEVRTGVGA